MSPYNAFDNNPVFWADPSGADSAIFEQGGTSYSSITTATGVSISAGGANGGENEGDPPKGNWFWDKKNSMFRFDPAMESEEQFNAMVEKGLIEGKYIGLGGEYQVTLGEKVIGRVSLHPGGSWTDATSSNTTQYVYHPNNGDSTYTNAMSAAGWGVHVHQTPYSIGLSGEATFVGGGGFEFGYFSGTYDSGLYLNLYWAGGISSGFGLNYTEYTTQGGMGPLMYSDLEGGYLNFQGSVFGIGKSYGQNYANDFGGYYETSGGGFSPSMIWNFKPKLGASSQRGHTYTFK